MIPMCGQGESNADPSPLIALCSCPRRQQLPREQQTVGYSSTSTSLDMSLPCPLSAVLASSLQLLRGQTHGSVEELPSADSSETPSCQGQAC